MVLVYGCSECNWIYRALTPEEASQMSWYAQIDFEKHDCSANQLTPPHENQPRRYARADALRCLPDEILSGLQTVGSAYETSSRFRQAI